MLLKVEGERVWSFLAVIIKDGMMFRLINCKGLLGLRDLNFQRIEINFYQIIEIRFYFVVIN